MYLLTVGIALKGGGGSKPKLCYLQSEIHLSKTGRTELPVGQNSKRDLVKSSLPSCQKRRLPVAAAPTLPVKEEAAAVENGVTLRSE